jgi:hypothetical protein
MTGFEVYNIYIKMNLHFNKNTYDYFKYQSNKSSIKIETFEKRNDRFKFEKISDKIPSSEIEMFFLPLFINDLNIYSLNFEEMYEKYIEFKKKFNDIDNYVEEDVSIILKENKKNINYFIPKNDSTHTPFIKDIISDKISIFSQIIFGIELTIFENYDIIYKDDVMWNDLSKKLIKLVPFILQYFPEENYDKYCKEYLGKIKTKYGV